MIAKCLWASLLWSLAFNVLVLPIHTWTEGTVALVLVWALKIVTGALTALSGVWAARRVRTPVGPEHL